jgi:hypothetical protein
VPEETIRRVPEAVSGDHVWRPQAVVAGCRRLCGDTCPKAVSASVIGAQGVQRVVIPTNAALIMFADDLA